MDKQIKGGEKVSEKKSNAGILIVATLKEQLSLHRVMHCKRS